MPSMLPAMIRPRLSTISRTRVETGASGGAEPPSSTEKTPAVLSHESAGIVEAVGDQVDYVKPGDHVITCVSGFCGGCRYCLSGRPNLCDNLGLGSPPNASRLRRGDQPVYQFAGLSSFAEQ